MTCWYFVPLFFTFNTQPMVYVLCVMKTWGYLKEYINISPSCDLLLSLWDKDKSTWAMKRVALLTHWFYFLIGPMLCLHRSLSPAQACSRPPSSPSTPCMSPGQPWPTTPVSPKKLSQAPVAVIITSCHIVRCLHCFLCFRPQTGSVTPVCWIWSTQAVQLHHQDLLLLPPPQTSSGGTLRASWDWLSSCSVLFTPGISWFAFTRRL